MDVRLQAAAAYIRAGSRLADIGTDHALLPTAMVARGRCPCAIASDIRRGPVAAATRTVAEAGLERQISVRLGDGLSTVQPDEVEDIVIAGMGGETIAAILQAAPWVQASRYRLILQPMTRAERLRRYLFDTGFAIVSETAVNDGRHAYTVLCAEYCGTPLAAEEALCYVGKVPLPQGHLYLERVCRRLQKQLAACPDEALSQCLARIRAYQTGEWTPWEETV